MILGDVFSSKLSQLLSYFRFALAKHGTEAEWNWLSLQWSSHMNSLLGEARSFLQSRGKLARAWEAVTAALLRALASSISELGEALWLLLQCQGKLRQDERHPKGEATLPNMREFLHFSSLTQRAPQKHHEGFPESPRSCSCAGNCLTWALSLRSCSTQPNSNWKSGQDIEKCTS